MFTGFLVAILAAALAAQDAPPQNPQKIGSGVSAPRVASKVEPEYSHEASRARMEGTVVLSLVVDPDGTPSNLKVTRALGLGLDEAAIEAVRKWRFKPGEKEGIAVPVISTIQINFRMLHRDGSFDLTDALFDVPGGSRPILEKAKHPDIRLSQSITLTFEIDEHGKPRKIRSEPRTGSESEKKLIAALREWRFQPAS